MPKNPAAVALGSMTSDKKKAASRENGKKGGRPKTWNRLVVHGDDQMLYRVYLGAKKNLVNQWSTKTLEDAELSVQLFMKENPTKIRQFVVIDFGKIQEARMVKEYEITNP